MSPLGEIAWDDLLEVVIVGAIAGIGLSAAFALLVRGAIETGTARREGRTGAAARAATLAVTAGVICVAAIVFAVVVMVQK